MRNLKIESLPTARTWIDADEVMLHACFQILKDCVDKEEVDTHCNYEAHKDFVDEVRFLCNWWETRKIEGSRTDDFAEDDEMLMRLMKIRTQLWT